MFMINLSSYFYKKLYESIELNEANKAIIKMINFNAIPKLFYFNIFNLEKIWLSFKV